MLPEHLFLDPVLAALQTTHAHLSLRKGDAIRYQAAVAPFAALKAATAAALKDLRVLLNTEEFVWVPGLAGVDVEAAQLSLTDILPCHQMVLPETVQLPEPDIRIVPLACADSQAMVALTDIAFPGFFRPRTCEMGPYFGIRDVTTRELIAMGGERLNFPGYSEISGLCTHPAHRGNGYAASLIGEIVSRHRREDIVSWLHVTARNETAVKLYLKLGFEIVRTISLYQLRRS